MNANNLQVATTILEQLGGRRFIAMTGAKGFVGDANSLTFKLPNRFAADGINAVKITLDADDTYMMNFYKIRGVKVEEVRECDGVYNDSLRACFTEITGLDCTL